MEQQYILNNKSKIFNSFEPKHIFECGQCFRWEKEKDNSYTGVFQNNVLNVNKVEDKIIFKGICEGDIKDVVYEYFDLNNDYSKIKEKLSKVDKHLKCAINYGYGIRILKQDLWETLISYIISSNNNIPRIKGIIEKLSITYGNKVIYNNKKYYTFPLPDELSKAEVCDLRKLGLGFRYKRVCKVTYMIKNKQINLNSLKKLSINLK
jgi:N-glycosylase/DNA lyase